MNNFSSLRPWRFISKSGFKPAADIQNLINQVAEGMVNRLQPVSCISRGIDPPQKAHLNNF
jgi:hypothetical protein